jgi:cell division protein FtsI/penicillin-binding protein 2
MLVVFAAVGVLRLAYWQVVMGPDLARRAQGQIRQTTSQPAVRGEILDRNGWPLATTVYRDTLGAWPNLIDDAHRAQLVDRLSAILDLDEGGRDALLDKLDPKERYAVLERELTEGQSSQVRTGIAGGELGGIELVPHAVRL